MDEAIVRKARHLADRFYSFEVVRDFTTDEQAIFMASNPELAGCMAQGTTEELALANLADARVDYIASLLEDDIRVPDPTISASITAGSGTPVIIEVSGNQSELEPVSSTSEGAEKEERKLLYRAALHT